MKQNKVSDIDLLRGQVEYLDNLVYELCKDRNFIMQALAESGLIEPCDSQGNQIKHEDSPLKIVMVVDNDKKY